MAEDFVKLIIGCKYLYIDGREVSVVQIDSRRGMVEVIIGKYNPFWVYINDLKLTYNI